MRTLSENEILLISGGDQSAAQGLFEDIGAGALEGAAAGFLLDGVLGAYVGAIVGGVHAGIIGYAVS